MKLIFSDPSPGLPENPHWVWYKKTVNAVTREGTEVHFTHLPEGYFSKPTGTYAACYNAIGMAQNAYRAEKKGYDAFLIGCALDLGLRAARGMLNIPVLAPMESSVHLASILGNKFSIIAFHRGSRGIFENQIAEYGLRSKLASVRCPPAFIDKSYFELVFGGEEGQKQFADIVSEEMYQAVIKDGAEALIVGCTIGSTVLSMRGTYEVHGVPIIDLVAAEIKMAEILVDLWKVCRIGVCKDSIYRQLPAGWEKEVPITLD